MAKQGSKDETGKSPVTSSIVANLAGGSPDGSDPKTESPDATKKSEVTEVQVGEKKTKIKRVEVEEKLTHEQKEIRRLLAARTEELEAADREEEQALLAARQAAADKRRAARAAENQLKILWGVVAQEAVRTGRIPLAQWKSLMSDFLTLDRDRKLAGIPLLGTPEANPKSRRKKKAS